MAVIKVHFQDHDQDFLFFTIDLEGNIIDVFPFQKAIWTKYKVRDIKNLEVGRLLDIKTKGSTNSDFVQISYPISKVEYCLENPPSEIVGVGIELLKYQLEQVWIAYNTGTEIYIFKSMLDLEETFKKFKSEFGL